MNKTRLENIKAQKQSKIEWAFRIIEIYLHQ